MVVDADLMVQYKINGRGSDDWRTGRLDDGRGSRQIARGLRGFGGQPSHRGSDGRGAMTTELRDAAAEVHRSAAEVRQPKVRRSGSLRVLENVSVKLSCKSNHGIMTVRNPGSELTDLV